MKLKLLALGSMLGESLSEDAEVGGWLQNNKTEGRGDQGHEATGQARYPREWEL